jgi:hypothetical protein
MSNPTAAIAVRRDGRIRQFVYLTLAVLSIVALSLLAWRDVLGYFFTGGDTLGLIYTSRVSGMQDVLRILSQPMMSGTRFTELATYYRPVASLSYSLDYLVWGLNPFGYQLTNVLLHVFVALSLFLVVRTLSGSTGVALLTAVLFAIHPIHVETVPVTARRHDMLAALFMLLSLWLFVRSFARSRGRVPLRVLSAGVYVLAMGSKETAIILPGLVFLYGLIFQPAQTEFPGRRFARLVPVVRAAVWASLPHVAVALVMLAWRTWVLGGLGGRAAGALGAWAAVKPFITTVGYVADLVYPVDFLAPVFRLWAGLGGAWAVVPGAVLTVVLVGVWVWAARRILRSGERRWLCTLEVIFAAFIPLALAGRVAFQVLQPAVADLLQQVYAGGGPALLRGAMWTRQFVSLDRYLNQASEYVVMAFAFGLFAGVAGVLAIRRRADLLNLYRQSPFGRMLLFMGLAVLLPLGVYLPTLSFGHHYLYIPALFFSGLLAILLVETGKALARKAREARAASAGAGFFALAALGLSLLAFSPLLASYRECRDSGWLSQQLLQRLSAVTAGLPGGSRLDIYELPGSILAYRDDIARARTAAGYLTDYSISSWISLSESGKQIDVKVSSLASLPTLPRDLRLEVQPGQDGSVRVTVRPEP